MQKNFDQFMQKEKNKDIFEYMEEKTFGKKKDPKFNRRHTVVLTKTDKESL